MSYYYQKLRSAVNFGFWRTGYYSFFDPDAESSVDDGEVYDDGTAIKNISVSGVAKKAAMFEPKSGKTTPPVLRKFRGQQQMNASGGDSTKSNQPEEQTTPSWVKKQINNGTVSPKPDTLPKSPTSPVSPKPAPSIPKKTGGVTHKWSPEKSPASSSKEAPGTNTFRKLSTDTKKPDTQPVLKDINHNVKTQPLKSNSDVATGNKRASVADLQKSFQSDSNSSSSDTRATSVKPLKENTSPVETKQSEEVVRRTSEESTVSESKCSILDRIASLESSSGAKVTTFNRKSMVTRKRDSKLFKRYVITKNDTSFDGPPPAKPPKLTDIDLEPIKAEYKQLQTKLGGGTVEEDIYDDIGNVMPQFSVIEPMTEEEEYADVGNVMQGDDMETYDDCSTAALQHETDEVYEPIDEEQAISGGSSSSKSKESEKERKKREDKKKKEQDKKDREESKKKEKEEKERKNELKKKENEEKKLFKALKITGSEPKQGEGVIRNDCTGTKLDLTLKSGDRVDIIRMDKNPSGKWLVKASAGRWGYVDSSNVEWMSDDQEYMNPDDVQTNGVIDDELYEEL